MLILHIIGFCQGKSQLILSREITTNLQDKDLRDEKEFLNG